MILKRQNTVIFNEEDHTYKNEKTGLLMTPVSRLKDKIKLPFQREAIASGMAYSESKRTGGDPETIKMNILAEWDLTAKIANDRGNFLHKGIEMLNPFLKESISVIETKIDEYLKSSIYSNMKFGMLEIARYLSTYAETHQEIMIYSEAYNVCGTSDNIGLRQNSKTSVVDIDDWKSNDITYSSIKIKNNVVKHNNKFYLPPFDYLEDCKYIDYAFQLSLYGVLFETTYNMKVGKLTIHNIDKNGIYTRIPVPYMKFEAIQLLELSKNQIQLPQTVAASSQSAKNTDDW